jgi:type III pantothenate kinase
MLFVIDVGNTNTVLGLFEGEQLLQNWRIRAIKDMTEDEFNILVTSLFATASIDLEKVTRTVISCVVPPIVNILDAFCRKYLGHVPYWVTADTVSDMLKQHENKHEVGADRIVNAVAGFEKYHTALIIIDFGTATTFDAISATGAYLGGAIAPGIIIASEALYTKASKLPRVELFVPPGKVIGCDTVSSMQSGIIYGYAGLVDGIVRRMTKEMRSSPPPKVIATGGLARLMLDVSETIEAIEPILTLEGLKIISTYLQT